MKLANPKHGNGQEYKVPIAPLPQKNAVSAPVGETAEHEDRLLDDALESTFPASDPIAEPPCKSTASEDETLLIEEEIIEHEEFLLDEALDLTFPASDPIAIPDLQTVAKAVLSHPHPHPHR